jgi:hypothetical protein
MCAFLGYDAAYGGNFLPTFRDNISVPFSRRLIGCPETSGINYRYRCVIYNKSAELIYLTRKPEIAQRRFPRGIFHRTNESVIDEGGGRILLSDDVDGGAIMLLPIGFQGVGTLYLNLCP